MKGELRALRDFVKNLSFRPAALPSPWLSRGGAWELSACMEDQRELTAVKMERPCKLLVSNGLRIITGFVQLQ